MTALAERLQPALERSGGVVALTGAGISAASGIPTFRGPGGYWTVGSRHYTAQEMATWAMFRSAPEVVWGWYLYRRGVCSAARPNPAHAALVDLERAAGDRFWLLTQNVDGLHLAAGAAAERTLQVHGNLHWMRCAADCDSALVPVPSSFGLRPAGEPMQEFERGALACGACGGWMRPHVLWFDETYDELRYRSQSALRAAADASLFLVIGTSAATSLPIQAAALAAQAGAMLVNVDPDENPLGRFAVARGGLHLAGPAVEEVPRLVAACLAGLAKNRS